MRLVSLKSQDNIELSKGVGREDGILLEGGEGGREKVRGFLDVVVDLDT